MMTRDDTTRDMGTDRRPAWPAYLAALRPDELTQHRMRRRVMSAAASLLERRPATWFDVTAGWSFILAPLAAGLLVVFGALAYRASTPVLGPAEPEIAILEPSGLVPALAPDVEGLPALLIDVAEPTRDAMLAAALGTPSSAETR